MQGLCFVQSRLIINELLPFQVWLLNSVDLQGSLLIMGFLLFHASTLLCLGISIEDVQASSVPKLGTPGTGWGFLNILIKLFL
jgi:hypothetical protein